MQIIPSNMKPAEKDIQRTIALIQDKLAQPGITKASNKAVKEGYTEALNVLVEDRLDYTGIDRLETVQGRAIAILAVDYLNGECTQKVLCGVPLK